MMGKTMLQEQITAIMAQISHMDVHAFTKKIPCVRNKKSNSLKQTLLFQITILNNTEPHL